MHAQEDHPILVAVKSQLKDHGKPFTMAVMITIKPECKFQFEAAFKQCIMATRQERDCIAYDLNCSTADDGSYVNYERWKSVAALDSHLKEAHTQTLLSTVAPYLASSPEIKVYTFAGE